MPLMQPQARSRSGQGFWERFGPGGEVITSASDFATQLGKEQLRSTFDPRTWNDPVTPQLDEQGRPLSAGVVLPLGPGNQMVNQLQDLLKMAPRSARTFEPQPLTNRMRHTARNYGVRDSLPLPSPAEQARREKVQMVEDYAEDYARSLPDVGYDSYQSQLPVSWDTGKGPLPEPPLKPALEKLLEKLRPTQMKQMKVFDDDELDFGPNWWEQGGNPFDKPYHAQPGVSPLEHDNPNMFRPIANHPLEQEAWIKDSAFRNDTRIPSSPRVNAKEHLEHLDWGRRYDTPRLKKIKKEIDREADFVNPQPIPMHPQAYSERYYKGAELNLVAKKGAPTLVQQLQRISRGRRGGV